MELRLSKITYDLLIRGLLVATLRLGSRALSTGDSGDVQTKEYCSRDHFEARCVSNQVIVIQKAVFGRMRAGHCITSDYKLGCFADVTTHLENICTGKQNCSIVVGTLDSVAQPCSNDLNSYLEASYQCVQVTSTDECHHGNQSVLRAPSGYLLVYGSAPNRPRGSPGGRGLAADAHCPWVIQADAGRRINITRVRQAADIVGLPSSDGSSVCPYVLHITEGEEVTTVEGCRHSAGDIHNIVYSSRTSVVEVKVVWRNPWERSKGSPLFHYKAYGCKDFVPPEGTHLKRGGDFAVVLCNSSLETWYLTCADDVWKGEPVNCSAVEDIPQISTQPNVPGGFHNGILVAVLIGVVLGIVVGAFMLFLIYLLKKGRRSNNRPSIPHTVESHYETRPHLTSDTSAASYPALLCQEKPYGPHACEYTHVWNVHPGNVCSVADMTYATATLDGQPATPKSQRTPCTSNRAPGSVSTSTFSTGRKTKPCLASQSASLDSCEAGSGEQINLTNFRPSTTDSREGFTPAYYELEAKLRNAGKNQRTASKRDDNYPDFHVVFKDSVDAL